MYNLYKVINDINKTSFKNTYKIDLPFIMLNKDIYNSILYVIFEFINNKIEDQLKINESKSNILGQLKNNILLLKAADINTMDEFKATLDKKASEIIQTYSDIELT